MLGRETLIDGHDEALADTRKLARDLLHANGVLYLSTMEDDYANSGPQWSSTKEEQAYIHYYDKEGAIHKALPRFDGCHLAH